MSRHRILVATEDMVGARRAGPAIRAWEIAGALAGEHEVRLVTTQRCELVASGFEARAVTAEELLAEVEWCDVVVTQGWVTARHPAIASSDKVLVVDVYDPMHLEQLEQGKEHETESGRWLAVQETTRVLNDQLRRADFLLCASERQRDFWLGQLAAMGRINPIVYDADPTLRTLIDVAPFGIPLRAPVPVGTGPAATFPAIGPDDPVLLWGGGVYNWFDPLTLLHAVAALRERIPNLRLVFMGMQHPNPNVPTMRMAAEAEALAARLGLVDRHVFFNHGWVPYEDRQAYLLEATVGVSTHLDHVETEFSYRTRVLDYLWAGLPVVVTDGDAVSTMVESAGLGLTVPAGDVQGLADAIARMVEDRELRERCRRNIAAIQPTLHWPAALGPLLAFCRQPARAPDLLDERVPGWTSEPIGTGWRADLEQAKRYLRQGGPRLVARQVGRRVRRIMGFGPPATP